MQLAGCFNQDDYFADRTAIDVARQLSWKNRKRVAVPVVRARDERRVHVRGDAMQIPSHLPDDDRPIRFTARRINILDIAGLIIGVPGAGLTVAGAALVANGVSRGTPNSLDISMLIIGGVRAITGGVLGIEGLEQHPQEVPTDGTDFIFLDRQ